MKLNGTKVTLYKDKFGPYDAYYHKGCMLSEISDDYKVVKVFDYEGDHIAVIRRNLHLGRFLLYLCIPLIIASIYIAVTMLTKANENLIIYREQVPYVNDAGDVVLNITNISPDTLYIIVNEMEYEIKTGDTLNSVPFFASKFTVKYKYNNAQTEEVIVL